MRDGVMAFNDHEITSQFKSKGDDVNTSTARTYFHI